MSHLCDITLRSETTTTTTTTTWDDNDDDNRQHKEGSEQDNGQDEYTIELQVCFILLFFLLLY